MIVFIVLIYGIHRNTYCQQELCLNILIYIMKPCHYEDKKTFNSGSWEIVWKYLCSKEQQKGLFLTIRSPITHNQVCRLSFKMSNNLLCSRNLRHNHILIVEYQFKKINSHVYKGFLTFLPTFRVPWIDDFF